MSYEINIGQVPRYLDERQIAWRNAAIRGMQSAGAKGLQDIIVKIIPSRTPQPVDRGIYRSGWRFVLTEDGCIIENIEPHSLFIEYGVRAENVKIGKKMIDAISEWAVRKGMVKADDANKVAWAIAKSMKRRGIFGYATKNMWSDSYGGLGILRELVERYLPKYIDEEIAREVIKEGF